MKNNNLKLIFYIFLTFLIVIAIKLLNTKDNFVEIQTEPEKSSIKMEDLSLSDENLDQKIKKIDVESHARKEFYNEKIKFKVMPDDSLYNDIKNNDNDIKKTLKNTDLKRPPIKGEIKINF